VVSPATGRPTRPRAESIIARRIVLDAPVSAERFLFHHFSDFGLSLFRA
jgi:hypothetical protein